jgi:DNA-directed RNA polymerase subunit RPC12/RpoP
MTGYSCSYLCSHCQFEEIFMQGPGFQIKPQSFEEYVSGNNKLFHYKIHEKIVALAKVNPAILIGASFQVYKCPHCKILYNKTQVNIFSGEQLLHNNVFKCTHCKRRLKLTNINRLKTATCPGCLKSTFHRQKVKDLLW